MAFEMFESDIVAVTETITLAINSSLSHCFAGIRYFNAAGTQITPTGGSVLVEARHVTNNNYGSVIRGTLAADEPGLEAEWGGNATHARATPSNIAGNGVATYQLVVAQNDD